MIRTSRLCQRSLSTVNDDERKRKRGARMGRRVVKPRCDLRLGGPMNGWVVALGNGGGALARVVTGPSGTGDCVCVTSANFAKLQRQEARNDEICAKHSNPPWTGWAWSQR